MQIRLAGPAALLFLAACGGESGSSTTVTIGTTTTAPVSTTAATTTTTQPGFVVTSEDGDLTVEVPFEAMAADPGITIRLLAPAEFPPELASAADDPDARIYNLEPEGLVFDAPVRVTRRLDAARFADLGGNEVPVLLMLTRNPDGAYEVYADLEVTRDGSDIFVSGATEHFSPAIVLRESPTAIVSIDREGLEDVGSLRSIDGVLTLMTEAPGTVSMMAAWRDRNGGSLTASGEFAAIDLRASPTVTGLVISCDEVEAIDVLTISYSTVFGSSPSAGVAGLTAVTELITDPLSLPLRVTLNARLKCLDPATSILHVDLTGFEVATDHPGGTTWIPNEAFRGGVSGASIRMGDIARLEGVWGGLIRDDDNNGQIDATDTLFPPYPVEEVGELYLYVAPLFAYGSYFIYLVDAPQYSRMPMGTEWTVAAGLTAFDDLYTGGGRFESSLGIVGTGGNPFEYEVGPSEELQQVPWARVEMFEFLRTDPRF